MDSDNRSPIQTIEVVGETAVRQLIRAAGDTFGSLSRIRQSDLLLGLSGNVELLRNAVWREEEGDDEGFPFEAPSFEVSAGWHWLRLDLRTATQGRLFTLLLNGRGWSAIMDFGENGSLNAAGEMIRHLPDVLFLEVPPSDADNPGMVAVFHTEPGQFSVDTVTRDARIAAWTSWIQAEEEDARVEKQDQIEGNVL